MTPADDLAAIIALAQRESSGKPIRYYPGLQLAYARTIVWLSENWQPKPKEIRLSPSDAEVRIKPS